jgi:Rieske 2Fe-2S family protein
VTGEQVTGETQRTPATVPTLGTDHYCSPRVFAEEQAQIFGQDWIYVCHRDRLGPGSRRVADVGGAAVIVSRDQDGRLHALANVCRHRGAELCPHDRHTGDQASLGPIRCGYHGWSYGLDGTLLATPRVHDTLDRAALGLWRHHVDEWNGLVFVSRAAAPRPLAQSLAEVAPTLAHFTSIPVGELRVGAVTSTTVDANWKILQENYAECLHCAVVHPELVGMIPLYRTGNVIDAGRPDTAVELAAGARTLSLDGASPRSLLPGLDPERSHHYDGVAVYPNLLFDVLPTCVVATALAPSAADRTEVTSEYLFAAEDVAGAGFDPRAEVDFNELVGAQDAAVCAMVQRGVASPAFAGGVLTAKDSGVVDFLRWYRERTGRC